MRALRRRQGLKKVRRVWRRGYRDKALDAELRAWDQLSDEALRNVLAECESARTKV